MWEYLDQDEEVGAKHIADTERFQPATQEPNPLLAWEPGELIELDHELLEYLTVARLAREDNTHIAEVTSIRDEEDNDVDDLVTSTHHINCKT